MTCQPDKCHSLCCTFLSYYAKRKDEDFKRYMRLHGVKLNEDENGVWLKIPVPCLALDPITGKCAIYENRPKACRDYPKNVESPFITSKQCSLMQYE